MTSPQFCKLLKGHDIVLLQETHLRPSQEEQLEVPAGHQLYACSRPETDDMRSSQGGVAALVSDNVPHRYCAELSIADCLVLQLPGMFLVATYWAPPGSPWYQRCAETAQQHLTELLAGWDAADEEVLIMGDLNARIAEWQNPAHAWPRTCPDTSGRLGAHHALVELCIDHDLVVLNGTALQDPATIPRFSSFQAGGQSMIDYALGTIGLASLGDVRRLSVLDREAGWSDHAPVEVNLCIRLADADQASATHPDRVPLIHPSIGTRVLPRTKLDDLLDDILEKPRAFEDAVDRLFGRAVSVTPQVVVYTDGSCLNTPEGRRAGAGIYWGPGSQRNRALRVPGKQTNNRGELYAILWAVRDSDPRRTLALYTDSQYGIRSVCHYALRHSQTGWKCENADILKDIVAHIRRREASVIFHWVKGHSGNAHNDGSDAEAKAGARLPGDITPYVPIEVPEDWPPYRKPDGAPAAPRERILKVHTSLARVPMATETIAGEHTAELRADESEEALNLRRIREKHYADLVRSGPNRQFWRTLRRITGAKTRAGRVAVAALKADFEKRMNPPSDPPPEFDKVRLAVNHTWAAGLPAQMADHTPGRCFSRVFVIEEVEEMKHHLREHHTGDCASGADGVDFARALNLDNDELLELFQECVRLLGSPEKWITTIIAAVAKHHKTGSELWDPANYRTIGLESILLKMLTLMIERRIREWAERAQLLPPTQNRFRAGYRTNNNALVLRTAIEQARSEGKTLYVAFVDLRNAFPSVDQPTLWAKLHRMGISGPLIDWLRMLYANMQYVVRHEGQFSSEFQALAGILTGDPASPILWDLFFSDVEIAVHKDDIHLGRTAVSHLEQADDVVLFSTSREGLQQKLDELFHWCTLNFMEIHKTKTECMLFGPIPRPMPALFVNGKLLAVVQEATYVGVTFRSTDANIFSKHIHDRTASARQLGNKCLSTETYIGPLPPWVSRTLYAARVDPYLTFACEITLDVVKSETDSLERVQRTYLRRMLGLSKRSAVAPLFTESGFMPINYRRALLALRYVAYLLCHGDMLVSLALAESCRLAKAGRSSWLSDLWHMLHNLPCPVALDIFHLTSESVQAAIAAEQAAMEARLEQLVTETSTLVLIKDRLEWDKEEKKLVHRTCAFRDYLRVSSVDHCRALSRLFAGGHLLGVAVGRHQPVQVPRERRICRLCRKRWAVEDEVHALLECESPELVELRDPFMLDAMRSVPGLLMQRRLLDGLEFLRALLSRHKLLERTAAYVHAVFEVYTQVPPFFAANDEVYWALSND